MGTGGAIFLLLLNLWLSTILLVITANGLGKWNIGGVPNSTTNKLAIFFAWVVMYFLWSLYLGVVYIDFNIGLINESN